MGFHLLDIIIVAAIGLALFGPKALQSIARNTGKGIGQAKVMKDKVMSELPMEDIAKARGSIPRVPLNSRQAMQMLVAQEQAKEGGREQSKEQATASSKDTIGQRDELAK